MVTLTARADIEAALAHPLLVPVPVPDPGGPEGSMAWLRATVARFAHGEVHARRRAFVEAELARIDVAALRRLAAGALGEDRARVLRALAEAMGLAALDDAAVAALGVVADVYFGGGGSGGADGSGGTQEPAADDAVRLLLPLMRTADPEQAANRIGILVQACDATAALIAATRTGSGDVHEALRSTPPVRVMRRVATGPVEVGTVKIPQGETVFLDVGPVGLPFGSGPRTCPGRALALALAEGAVEGAAQPPSRRP